VDLISQFISRYRKEFDFYEQACRMVAQVLDSNLQSAGIRAIVTSRAKNPVRLETKVRQRALSKVYKIVDDIYDDIVDLAGVRVALYFPAESGEVGRIVRSVFVPVADPKSFPTEAKPTYKKRFSGYWATHYRVRLPETLLNDSQKRYAEARVEIQVASVLMHAWSEVEHDLVYKPLQGKLSEDEYAILDELNGLVLAGEIALERLQRAGEVRVSVFDREYTNHYDLASSLLEMSRAKLAGLDIQDSAIGRVDLLFELLRNLALNKPQDLARYIDSLHADFERRPLAEQVIDQVLAEDVSRYSAYEQVRALDVPAVALMATDLPRASQSEAIGQFMSLWIDYERMLRTVAATKGQKSIGMPSSRFLSTIFYGSDELIQTAETLRHFRNQLVHGIEVPEAEFIRAQTSELRWLIKLVQDKLRPPAKSPRKSGKRPSK
jgi:ppGpp synthetase/RelA/SpoT-type nucleotidyltranferase